MNVKNDDVTTNDEKNPMPTCESGTGGNDSSALDAIGASKSKVDYPPESRLEDRYSKALDAIRKVYRMWRTGERGYVGMCNDIDQFLKDVGK